MMKVNDRMIKQKSWNSRALDLGASIFTGVQSSFRKSSRTRRHACTGHVKNFIFCVHAHQPVGNFHRVFDEAYERCYRPFFDVIEKHPHFPLVCHLSGSLIDWLESQKPEFLDKLKVMSERGQIEFLGGAYYEPVFGAIPKHDLVGQIEMTRDRICGLLGAKPTGAWITERIWDPHLPEPLAEAGIEYTVLDDYHLERSAVSYPGHGYHRVRYGSDSIDVFASVRPLRYLIPFRHVDDSMNYVHSMNGGQDSVIVFADDCEKFGLWPGTHGLVYKQNWLDKFLTTVEEDPNIALHTFSGFRKKHRPAHTAKIPHASYSEMMEWSKGSFYNFFDKYPESRYMRDRMLAASAALQASRGRTRSEEWAKARDALYRAQCNCSYWHGVFGGLYLHHLRSAVFENLIKVDYWLAQGSGAAATGTGVSVESQKMGSGTRWVLRQKQLVSYIDQEYGASVEELDYLPLSVNLMCNLKRHREQYHRILTGNGSDCGNEVLFSIHQLLGCKDKHLSKYLHYDRFRRLSFMDHFFEAPVNEQTFVRSEYAEAGDFIGSPYLNSSVRHSAVAGSVAYERKGSLQLGEKKHPIKLIKTFTSKGQASLGAVYRVENTGHETLRFVFATEFNFSIGDNASPKRIRAGQTSGWIFEDAWRGIEVRLFADRTFEPLSVPIETVSGSESGLERNYQGTSVLLQRPVRLAPKQSAVFSIVLEIA